MPATVEQKLWALKKRTAEVRNRVQQMDDYLGEVVDAILSPIIGPALDSTERSDLAVGYDILRLKSLGMETDNGYGLTIDTTLVDWLIAVADFATWEPDPSEYADM